MVRVTSARPSGGRDDVPAKTTSSILPPRRDLAPCSPMTQQSASTMLDLPDPFGPTAHVMPGSKRSVVADAKDLNPRNVRLFRYTRGYSSSYGRLCTAALRTLPRRPGTFWYARGAPRGRLRDRLQIHCPTWGRLLRPCPPCRRPCATDCSFRPGIADTNPDIRIGT